MKNKRIIYSLNRREFFKSKLKTIYALKKVIEDKLSKARQTDSQSHTDSQNHDIKEKKEREAPKKSSQSESVYTFTSVKLPPLEYIFNSAYINPVNILGNNIRRTFLYDKNYLRTEKNEKIIKGGEYDLETKESIGYANLIRFDPSEFGISGRSVSKEEAR